MINNTLAIFFITSMLLMFKTSNQRQQKNIKKPLHSNNDGIVFILIFTMKVIIPGSLLWNSVTIILKIVLFSTVLLNLLPFATLTFFNMNILKIIKNRGSALAALNRRQVRRTIFDYNTHMSIFSGER